MYVNGKYTSDKFIGTGDGWAYMYSQRESEDSTGDKVMGIITNRFLPASMVLHEKFWDLEPHGGDPAPHNMTYGEINGSGWDMFIIELDSSSIHTYASEEGSPGKPQNNDPPRFGEYDIVKCYRTYNETTGEYTDDGTTSRTSCVNRVSVDDEPEYKIVQWDTSSSTNTGMSSLSYSPPGSIQHGETSKLVKLDKTEGEKCIYVLLERRISDEVEEEDYNYLLPQSRINKKIK